MEREEIRGIIISMDQVRGSAVEDLREQLVPLGAAVLPEFLDLYPVLRRWESRNAIVYTAIKFSRTRPEAAALAKQALHDRSSRVRYFAAMLLAVGQDCASISDLEPLLNHADKATREDAAAAIDAIKSGNQNRFLDRKSSGQSTLTIVGLELP